MVVSLMHGPASLILMLGMQQQKVWVSRSRYATETFDIRAKLPWDHTSPGVSKSYLQREYRKAMDELPHQVHVYLLYGMCGMPRTLRLTRFDEV